MGIIKNVLNSKGIERAKRKLAVNTGMHLRLKRLTPSASEEYRTVKILNTFKFNKILDIGANTGQFAESLIDFGFKGKIISIEPTSRAYAPLVIRAAKYANWTVFEKCAIGNNEGTTEINLSKSTLFSSIKMIKQEYTKYNQDSSITSVEQVKLYTLDSLRSKLISKDEQVFLKIDTQGFEKEVLEGAAELLQEVKGIKIEIPLHPIYEDVTWKIDDIFDFFNKHGFSCVSLNEVAVNNESGIVHEIDGVFIAKELLSLLN